MTELREQDPFIASVIAGFHVEGPFINPAEMQQADIISLDDILSRIPQNRFGRQLPRQARHPALVAQGR